MSDWKPESVFVSSFTIGGTGAAQNTRGNTATGGGGGMPVTPEWRRWIAENVLLQNSPDSIAQAMVKAGIHPQTAADEVRAALNHPYILAARQLGTKGAKGENLENKLKKRDWVLELYRRSAQQATTYGQVPRVPNTRARNS
jgi:hypothetical protein